MPDDVVHILGKCAAEIEQHIHHMEQQVQHMLVNPASQHLAQLHNLLDMVVNARVSRDNLSSLRLIRKVRLLYDLKVFADTPTILYRMRSIYRTLDKCQENPYYLHHFHML